MLTSDPLGILEVFYSPGTLFASLPERKGAWVLPFLLNIVIMTVVAGFTMHYIGIEAILRQQFEGTRMAQEQVDTIVQQAANAPAWRNYLSPVIGTALFLPILGGLMYAFALMSNKNAKYGDQFSMVCYAYFPYYLITCLMTVLILLATSDPASLNVKNLIATNAAAFVDRTTTSKGMYALLSSLDLLSFLEICLLAYGFSKVNRAKLGYGFAAVIGLWVLYVSVKLALSAIF